jgi:outer membrane lipoprotein-sorting protein
MYRNLFNWMLFVIIGSMMSVGTVQAKKVDDIIKKVQKKYRDYQTIHVEFVEKTKFSLTGAEVEVPAKLLMQGKDKFRLESEDQVLVADGETFWRYNKLDNQVLIDYAKKGDQDVMLNTFLSDFRDQYFAELIDEEKQDGKKLYVIKLVPKPSENSMFTTVKIWVKDNDWEITRIIYEDYNQNETEYVITKTLFNPKFPNTVFAFTPPEGIEVVDLRF